MELLANGSIDGFIMSLSTETQQKNDYNHIKEVTDQGIPMVMFDRVTDRINCDKVVIDDAQGAFLAVKKFVESGKKKIALITTDDYLSVGKARTEGYKKALSHYNIPLEESLILKLPSMEVEASAFDTFFKTQEVDAVLCVNEIFAIHAMRLVHGMNKRIPEDISFIGFTDGLLSKFAMPSLTAIAQHGELMGEEAARMLIEKVETESEEETFSTTVLEPTLIERASTL
jgi:LacI family transcriptional regulator